MAFSRTGLRKMAALGTLGASTRPRVLYGYVDSASLATMYGTGYFNDLINELGIGDMMLLGGSSGADVALTTVTSVTTNVALKSESGSGLTDNSGGAIGTAIAAGVGKYVLPLFVNLASIAGNGDILTNYVPGHKFKILSADFVVCKAVTTGSKAADLNLEIGTTNVTGGVVALTSALATPAGAKIAGSAVTAANTGSATDTLSVEAANVTAFAEGDGWLLIGIQNMDTADALASLNA